MLIVRNFAISCCDTPVAVAFEKALLSFFVDKEFERAQRAFGFRFLDVHLFT